MNSKIIISSIVLSSLVLVSCKKELEPQENTPTSELVKLGLMKDTTKVNTAAAAPAPTANPNTVMNATGGINPAHGQPGHRCDIAVGAPLNSAPTQTQTQTTTTQTAQTMQVNPGKQVVTTTTTTAAPVKVAKGMNPSHGQPGHRCDIPVGAPLNSPKASTTATASAPSQGGSFSQKITVTPPPAKSNLPALLSTETTNQVAEGMNPAHGQPGHRCDIPVGQPLPKS